MVREDNEQAGKIWTWKYDDAGNLTHHREYEYSDTGMDTPLYTMRYTYGDASWGDLLTAYNGVAITYDEIGNPLNDGTWTYTWEHGRQMASMSDGTATWDMTYNADGLRTGRTNGSNTYTYWYNESGQLVRMKFNSLIFRIAYGASGQPISISYNGNTYYYVLNQQGDVMALLDSSGNWVVKYTYDAWGNILTTTASTEAMRLTLAKYNPLRYRGYIYDRETGLYYLQSRYYNPEIGRFINADSVMGVNDDLNTYNLFTYCGNNPANRYDDGGMVWRTIWNGIKKATRAILQKGNKAAQAIGIDTAAIGAYFLNKKKDRNGIYHATFNCWQQYFGYNDMYDFMFDVGTSMSSKKSSFSTNNQSYILWAWKGDYINLGAGAELGIYYGGGPHWLVDKSLAMNMSMTVKYRSSTIINYTAKTWWMTGFNPNYQDVKASDLTAIFVVTFNGSSMFYAFMQSQPSGWTFNPGRLTATLIF